MAFNWGAFAGGAAKGFNETYKMLSEEEERALAIKERRDRLAREQQMREAAAQTIGQAGQTRSAMDIYGGIGKGAAAAQIAEQNAGFGDEAAAAVNRATIESAQYAKNAPKTAVPMTEDVTGSRKYTQSEAMSDYANRVAAIDPEKAITYGVQAKQLKKMESEEARQADFDKSYKKFQTDLATIQGTAESGGMKGMAELAKKNGLNVKFVEGANGTGRIEVLGKDGKVAQTFTDVSSAADALSQARMGQFINESIPTLGSADKVLAALASQQKMTLDKKADERAERQLPGQMAYTAAQTKKALTEAAGAELKGKEAKEYADLRSRMIKILEKPTAENQEELRQLARRAALLNPKEVLVTKAYTDPETGIAKTITTNVFTGEVQESLREAGVPNISKPQLDKVRGLAAQGLNGNGKPATAQDIADYERQIGEKWPGPAQSGNRPTSAIPAAPATPSPAQRVAATGPQRYPAPAIPEPPPPKYTGGRGGQRINPAYLEWEQRNQQR